MSKLSSSPVLVRKYQKEDYEPVCRIFKDGICENWKAAYRRTITGESRRSWLLQTLVLVLLYSFTNNILMFLMAELSIQLVWAYVIYYGYWNYTRLHLNSDMKDRDLKEWNIENKTGFLVATTNGNIAGTVAYIKQDENLLEIFRLSVDKSHRKLGVGQILMESAEEISRDLGCSVVKAETSDGQEGACAFYIKLGYKETYRFSIGSGNWLVKNIDYLITGLHVVAYCKNLTCKQ